MSRLDLGDPTFLEALAAALTAAGVDGIEIEQPSGTVRIVVDSAVPGGIARAGAPLKGPASTGDVVTAPTAGVVERDAMAATLPRTVAKGEILGFLRIGPILLPVRASGAGVLIRCLADEGALVGFGDPLFEIGLLS